MAGGDAADRPQGTADPGAQLRIADADGLWLTAFATNTMNTPIATLEVRHRRRARAEERMCAARATGLPNLPLHRTAQNQIWLEIVQIALDLLAWMSMLALTGVSRLWEPRRLRLRLFSTAAQLVTTGRRRVLRLAGHWPPWTGVITHATTTARGPAEPRLTCNFPPLRIAPPTGAVEPGAHPTRQPGQPPAHHQARTSKRPASRTDGPSRNIEVRAAGRNSYKFGAGGRGYPKKLPAAL
jgi:hypothetical protein